MSDQVQSTPTRSGLKIGLQLGVIAIAAALAVACGGGGVGSNSTGSAGGFSSGTVTGLGSVFVNGVEYDDSSSSVVGEDGDDRGGSNFTKSSTPLRVGMEVELESNDVVCTTDATVTPPVQVCTAKASSISYSAGLAGPVAGLTPTATLPATFTVLGQTVNVTAATHFQTGKTVTDVLNGEIVKVYGRPDANGVVNASYLEIKAADFATLATAASKFNFRLRGALNKTAPATIAGEPVDLSGVDTTALTSGQVVQVRITPAATIPANGWKVVSIKARKLADHKGKTAEVGGAISAFMLAADGLSATFKVDGLDVKVTKDNSVKFEEGTSFVNLTDGVLVEIKGPVNADGVLVANKVEFKSESTRAEIELKDTISNVDTTAKTFQMRGYTVEYSTATVFVPRKNQSFAIGDIVPNFAGLLEVQGHIDATSGHVIADSIKRDNN